MRNRTSNNEDRGEQERHLVPNFKVDQQTQNTKASKEEILVGDSENLIVS